MLVLVAPGQGAQKPGLLSPWLDVEGAAERLAWWSAVCDLDLVHYGTNADEDTIRDTTVVQPLLVASGLLAYSALFPHQSDALSAVDAMAGHSVGEITVAAISGAMTAESALVLVRERAKAMAEAASSSVGGMMAVLGGDRETVLAKAAQHGLAPANENGAGQIVIAGPVECLEAFQQDPPDKARLRPLSVAGAFHTDLMAPAAKRLGSVVTGMPIRDPRVRYLSNTDGTVVHDGAEVLRRLVRQVANPVRWDLCMATMAEIGVTAVIELPPAGTLSGLVRRALPGVRTLALKTPDQLEEAREVIAEHGTPSSLATTPSWRVVVAPSSGTVRLAEMSVGASLMPGAQVATISSHRDSEPVLTRHGGTIIEWLVADGDPVGPGQPLLRLHPTAPTDIKETA